MSTRVIPICLFLCFQFLAAHPAFTQSFKGKWQGTSEGEVGQMTFDKKGYVAFIIRDDVFGGKKFSSDGVDLSMKYIYDEEAEPHTIDFILSLANDGMELSRMLGIYQFINEKTLIINMDFNGNARPEKFDPEDKNQISLTRIK